MVVHEHTLTQQRGYSLIQSDAQLWGLTVTWVVREGSDSLWFGMMGSRAATRNGSSAVTRSGASHARQQRKAKATASQPSAERPLEKPGPRGRC